MGKPMVAPTHPAPVPASTPGGACAPPWRGSPRAWRGARPSGRRPPRRSGSPTAWRDPPGAAASFFRRGWAAFSKPSTAIDASPGTGPAPHRDVTAFARQRPFGASAARGMVHILQNMFLILGVLGASILLSSVSREESPHASPPMAATEQPPPRADRTCRGDRGPSGRMTPGGGRPTSPLVGPGPAPLWDAGGTRNFGTSR